ncbi:MAG: ABC transporter substrate-binding protein [Acetatifactor sp.]|nr:ABC transporter substrate-binding protein [Acetatifactor sp.]
MNISKKKKTAYVLMGLMFLMTTVITGCGKDKDNKLKVGVLSTVDSVPLYIGSDDGLYEDCGLDVELVEFSSASDQSKALEAGEIDVVMTDMIVQSLLTKGGCSMKTVMLAVGEKPAEGQFMVVASPNSDYEDGGSIEGAKIAISEGTMIEFLIDSYCEELGVDENKIEKVTVPSISLRMEMLLEGNDIDMALLPEPLGQYAIKQGCKCMIDDTTLDKNLSQTVIAFREDYIKQHSENVDKFVSAYSQAVNHLNESPQKYRERVLEIANVPEGMEDEYVVTIFSKNAVPEKELVSRIENWMVDKKLLDSPYTYEELVDDSFIKQEGKNE